jgi:hypothetical protein
MAQVAFCREKGREKNEIGVMTNSKFVFCPIVVGQNRAAQLGTYASKSQALMIVIPLSNINLNTSK